MYPFKRNEIIVLLGAGASVEAQIPHSAKMIEEVEKLINCEDPVWSQFRDLYNYIRSSIYHSDGIRGRFGNDVNYNIERLVNTLDEIKQKHKHPLYPFVGAWNPTLVEVAGKDFELIGRLRDEIVRKLRKEWIALRSYNQASYFQGLVSFQNEYQHPLRVFTLNYDLCVEKVCSGVSIETGFDENSKWDWRQFDDNSNDPKDIFLYKLHGSTNWVYENENLTYFDDTSLIDDAAIIFGTSYKLQYRDPFLFLAYEFRRWTLEARIIICIGYGFGDEHINKIIQQALKSDEQRLLLSVSPLSGDDEEEVKLTKQQERVAQAIEHKNPGQIICCNCGAQKFMMERLQLEYLSTLFPSSEDELFPIVSNE